MYWNKKIISLGNFINESIQYLFVRVHATVNTYCSYMRNLKSWRYKYFCFQLCTVLIASEHNLTTAQSPFFLVEKFCHRLPPSPPPRSKGRGSSFEMGAHRRAALHSEKNIRNIQIFEPKVRHSKNFFAMSKCRIFGKFLGNIFTTFRIAPLR